MVTATDVAERAGVSPATVSRVMSNSGYASVETKALVLKAARELGYVPNAIARGLKTQRTGLIAFLMPEVLDPFFFTTLSRGVEEVANAAGYHLILGNTDEKQAKERTYIELMIANGVEGMIITPSVHASKAYKLLAERGTPTVIVDRMAPGFDADTVRSDDRHGAELLVEHLAALGHSRIALVNGHLATSVAADRDAGFRAAMKRAGLPVDDALVSSGTWFIEDAERRVETMFARGLDFSAIIATNLYMTIGTMRALRRHNVRVPEDVALVSFNDLELAAEIDPFLTALSQPISSMGRMAMGLLLDRVQKRYAGPSRQVLVTPTLTVRRSCGSTEPIVDASSGRPEAG